MYECDGCGQPIPRTAKFSASTVTAAQLSALRRSGRPRQEPSETEQGSYALTLCLNCRIELSKLTKGL